ncbi:MAG: nucleotidyltransferase domain-containing protein [Candidatus Margulisiibacteriota bacterium]
MIAKEELTKYIVEIVRKQIQQPHYKLFYFGSRVNGKADERSDIDIGIIAEANIPWGVIGEIEAELEESVPVLQKFDFVDFNIVSDDFKKIALKDIEIIYEQ